MDKPHVAKPAPGVPRTGDVMIGEPPRDWKVGIRTGDRHYTIQAAFSKESLADDYVAILYARFNGSVEAVVLAPIDVYEQAHPSAKGGGRG